MSRLFLREPVDVVLVKDGDKPYLKVVRWPAEGIEAASPVFRVCGLDYWAQLDAEAEAIAKTKDERESGAQPTLGGRILNEDDAKARARVEHNRKVQSEVVRCGILSIDGEVDAETIDRFVRSPPTAMFLPLFLFIQELTWGN